MQATDLADAMKVEVPEGISGRFAIQRFEVEADSFENMVLSFQPGGRQCKPGTYSRLTEGARIWMSDTTAEQRDHHQAAYEMRHRGGRVLLGGLGLGMIVRAALLWTEVDTIDVIERNSDVIALVWPHYVELAERLGKTVNLIEDDAFEWLAPKGVHWTVAYFDVWPDMCEDNLPEMAMLGRRFNKRRADVTLHWGRELILAEKRRTANAWWRS